MFGCDHWTIVKISKNVFLNQCQVTAVCAFFYRVPDRFQPPGADIADIHRFWRRNGLCYRKFYDTIDFLLPHFPIWFSIQRAVDNLSLGISAFFISCLPPAIFSLINVFSFSGHLCLLLFAQIIIQKQDRNDDDFDGLYCFLSLLAKNKT